jgi:putative colanic acid biosynthesis acetyltransferase WcaF
MDASSTLGADVICYNVALVHLEEYSIVSERSYICPGSHDIDDPSFQIFARPIRIGRYAWIAVEAFLGPGVTVGEGAVLGARGVASKDMQPWGVYAGNPAKYIRQRKQQMPAQNQ